jgi:hypothetical protein
MGRYVKRRKIKFSGWRARIAMLDRDEFVVAGLDAPIYVLDIAKQQEI